MDFNLIVYVAVGFVVFSQLKAVFSFFRFIFNFLKAFVEKIKLNKSKE